MSTTFGIKVKDEIIEVAFRGNGGTVRWLNNLAQILPAKRKVIALDNTHQGIYSISDIKKEIKEQIKNE